MNDQKKLTPEQAKALVYNQRKPLPPVKKPVQKPKPHISYQGMIRTYTDTPGFGFDVLQLKVDDETVEIYRACSFADNGGVPVTVIPTHNGVVFTSLAEADAYQKQIKEQALKPKLITPGSPEFKAPRLH